VNVLLDLQNKTAVVTGGAQGLGLGMATGLLEAGVRVCIIDRSQEVHEIVENLRAEYPSVYCLQADLGEVDKLPSVISEAIKLLDDEIDILVNNAGIHKSMEASKLPLQNFRDIFNVNVTAVFELSRLVAAKMVQKGAGKIINIASVLAFQGGYHAAAYSSSKGAVAQLTKSLSNEWASKGIQVNAIAPGYFNTDINRHILNDPDRFQSLIDRIPAGRFGYPEELKGAVQFLASEKSNYINGIILPVDGGFLGR